MSDLFVAAKAVRVASRPVPFPDRRCAVCGVIGGFGFDVFLRQVRPGRWSCFVHRAEVERMVR